MARNQSFDVLALALAYENLTLDSLRPLAGLLGLDKTMRKTEIVPSLLRKMASEEQVKSVYDALGPLQKSAIQEAVADPLGKLEPSRFQAKYGRLPKRGYRNDVALFDLFFPCGWSIPVDLVKTLRTFVPAPPPVTLESADKLPETVPEQRPRWRHEDGKAEPQLVPLRQRLMEAVAPREFTTLLRLAETGKIRVSEKTRKPAQATVELIEPLLVDGDFYEAGDRAKYAHDPAYDLAIRAYAWPCILQAAGLVSLSGARLELSKAGRKAIGQEMHVVIRDAWKKWLNTKLFDEFERIEVIKGKSPARLSSVVDRRRAVSQVLAECPPGKWIDVDEFFRYLKALDKDFTLARDLWKLYILDQEYGSLGYEYSDASSWNLLQGRFILAFLFEFAATLGLVDVAYVPPQLARNDFRERCGTDEYSSLSRYDGLEFFRLNALGAWCLGVAENYQPEVTPHKAAWRVLPNLEVVSVDPRPNPADVLFLDRVAQRTTESVWRLDREKLLRSIESGLEIDLVANFLADHSAGAVPSTVSALLDSLRRRTDQIKDLGIVRLIECSDEATAQTLLLDPKLKTLCQAAGKRGLIFKAKAESQVREHLRKLGYVLPISLE